MGIIRADAGKTVRIGYQGENKRQRVAFPLQDIMEEFPGGTAVLAILRKDDTDPVPAAITEMDGTDLIWTVTAWECAKEGYLYAQITYAVGEVVSKTKTYRFDIKNSLIVSAAEPETWQDMVGQLVTAAAALQAAIAEYDAMTAAAIALPAGSDPTAEIDRSGEHPVLRLGIAPGADGHDGEDGYSPSASVVKVGKKATITIVDKDGTTTAEISDGEDGQGGDVIDDTAGAGDTDKTWSADKLTDELAGKYEKPSSGIPATDLAAGVIPDPTDLIDDTAGAGDTDVTFSADKLATDHSSLLSAINVLSNDVYQDNAPFEYDWESGNIKYDTGGNSSTTTKIRTKTYIDSRIVGIKVKENYAFCVFAYDGNGNYQGLWNGESLVKTSHVFLTSEVNLRAIGNYSFRIALKKSNDGNINTDEYNNLVYVALAPKYDKVNLMGIEFKNFVTPEQFGAIGDDVANSDQIGINAAIEYAKSHKCAVVGMGTYKTYGAVNIIGSQINIYIKKINAKKSSEPAIKLSADSSHIIIDRVESYSEGIVICNDVGNANGCTYNKIEVNTFITESHCIKIDGDENATVNTTGSSFYVEYAKSSSGSCVYSQYAFSDNLFSGAYFHTSSPNYAINLSYSGTWTFVNPNFEHAYNGIYDDSCVIELQSPRFREMSDQQRENETGHLAVKIVGFGAMVKGLEDIDCVGLDVSEREFDTTAESFYSFTAGKTWRYCNSRYYNDPIYQTYFNRAATIFVYGNHFGIIPEDYTYLDVSDDIDVSDLRVSPPNEFIVSADSEITLSHSYCSIGINRVVIEQKHGAKATVKDYDDNTIFDGTNYPDGRYVLSAKSPSGYTGHTGYFGFYETNSWAVEAPNIDYPYRLIKEITISDDSTKQLFVNSDSNGNSFSLWEAVLIFDMTAASGGSNGAIYVNTNGTGDGTYPVLNVDSMFATSAGIKMAKIEVEGGRFFGNSTKAFGSWYNTSQVYTSKNATGFMPCKSINTLLIQSMNGHIFGNGSVIQIYGR